MQRPNTTPSRKEAAPASGYTTLGTITADVASLALTQRIFRPRAHVWRPLVGYVSVGLTIPQIAFDAGWDGGDLTLTGADADGVAQSEVITASAGNTVVAVNSYATLATVSGSGAGTVTYSAVVQCSEGWHIQIPDTQGIRVGVGGTLVQTLDGGSVVTETFTDNEYCYGNVAVVGPSSTATGCVAYGDVR